MNWKERIRNKRDYQERVKQTKELIELTIEEIIAKHVGIDPSDKSITTKIYLNEDGTITVVLSMIWLARLNQMK